METIYNLRKERKISQFILAQKMNVSQGTISAWERGSTHPDIQQIVMLADYFGVSTDYILGRTRNPLTLVQVDTPYVKTTVAEKALLEAYRAAPVESQAIVCKILDIEHPAIRAAQIKKHA